MLSRNSVKNYHYWLLTNQAERSIHLFRGASLKSRIQNFVVNILEVALPSLQQAGSQQVVLFP
jgi:hypothetical protein